MSNHQPVTEADIERGQAAAFGRRPASASESRAPMSLDEAYEVDSAAAFGRTTNRGAVITSQMRAEADRLLSGYVAQESAATPPALASTGQVFPVDESGTSVLDRVAGRPGQRTGGFSESQDRRMDESYKALVRLSESRLGLPRRQAEDSARRTFLETQHQTATAKESKDRFCARLEQRVAALNAVPALITEAGGR